MKRTALQFVPSFSVESTRCWNPEDARNKEFSTQCNDWMNTILCELLFIIFWRSSACYWRSWIHLSSLTDVPLHFIFFSALKISEILLKILSTMWLENHIKCISSGSSTVCSSFRSTFTLTFSNIGRFCLLFCLFFVGFFFFKCLDISLCIFYITGSGKYSSSSCFASMITLNSRRWEKKYF